MSGTYEFIETESRTVSLKVEPCIECGGTNIKPFDCGYTSFNVCGAKCVCGRQVSRIGDYTKRECVELWNSVNGDMDDARRVKILREQLRSLNHKPEV